MWLTPVPWLETLNVPNTVLENAFTGWVVRDVLLNFFIVFCVFTVLGRYVLAPGRCKPRAECQPPQAL